MTKQYILDHPFPKMDINQFTKEVKVEEDAMIAWMEAYAAEREMNEWISVGERLPPAMPNDHQSELVIVTDRVGAMQDVTYYTHRHDCWGNTRWVGKITHWRPMLKPPENAPQAPQEEEI